MQNGFVQPAEGDGIVHAGSVLDAVNRWSTPARARGWPVFCTRDIDPFGTHPPTGVTAGARAEHDIELHPGLSEPGTIVDKGPGSRAGFSGFVLASSALPSGAPGGGGLSALAGLLRTSGVQHLVVVGLTADVCVSATALDARRLGYEVTVDLAATAFAHAHPGGDAAAIEALRDAGVRLENEVP